MKEVADNAWITIKGDKFILIQRPNLVGMAVYSIGIIIILFSAIASFFSNAFFVTLLSLVFLTGALFAILKFDETTIDFTLFKIIKSRKVLSWNYKKDLIIDFQLPLNIYIKEIIDSDAADSYMLCAEIDSEHFTITKLNDFEVGECLIAEMKKRLGEKIINGGVRTKKV